MRCFHPITINRYNKGSITGHIDTLTTGCGKCLGCRINKAEMWTARCLIEQQHTQCSLFLTLTYNDDNLPCDNDGFHPIVKKDLQLYFKTLRNNGLHFRYFAVGEYGGELFRPHYHILLFLKDNLPFNTIYRVLSNSWGQGHIQLSPLKSRDIKYVLRYFIDKTNTLDKLPEARSKQIPFALMSRKPAIGFQLTENPDKLYRILQDGYIFLGKKYPLHDYYRNFIKVFNENRYNSIMHKKENKRLKNHHKTMENNVFDATTKFIEDFNKLKSLQNNLTSRRNML